MDYSTTEDISLFEHRFWLQIMGDHARFIFYSLSPNETEYIQKAYEFMNLFDRLLEESRQPLSGSELNHMNQMAYEVTIQFREFKLLLLALTLSADLHTHLTSTFFNDMLNELDEYLNVLYSLFSGQIPIYHPIHYHTLWLTDAIGHSASITAELDPVEKDMILKGREFEVLFSDLEMKASMFQGYLRTQLSSFPALDRLNKQAEEAITDFMNYLFYIREMRTDGRLLGTLLPLVADHMAREECYYLWKLSESTENIKKPDCDPTKPRIQV